MQPHKSSQFQPFPLAHIVNYYVLLLLIKQLTDQGGDQPVNMVETSVVSKTG